MVLKLRPEHEAEYRKYHDAVWPEVLEIIKDANIRNYTIFLRNGMLFGYYEYVGTDWAKDMETLGQQPKMREWWNIMEPMQQPLEDRKSGEWWSFMEEVFHTP